MEIGYATNSATFFHMDCLMMPKTLAVANVT